MSPVEAPYDGGDGHTDGPACQYEGLSDRDSVGAGRWLRKGGFDAANFVSQVSAVDFTVAVERLGYALLDGRAGELVHVTQGACIDNGKLNNNMQQIHLSV